jgi:integrase
MSLYERPNSKYYWMKFTFDGELVQRSTKCTSKIKAREVEAAFRHELVLGRIGIKPKVAAPTFDEAVKDFLKWSKVNHADKPNSYKRVKYSCESLKKFFGKTKVDRIDPKTVENFIIWRSGQTSKKTKDLITRDTINLELIALKTIFKRLVSQDVLIKSPANNIKQLPENDRKFYVLTRDDENKYLMACPQPLRDVARLMIETGMRPAEIYQLKRENVSIEKRFLKVENSKTKSSNRRIWLTEKAALVLRGRIEKFKAAYLFPKGDEDGNPPTYPLNDQHNTARRRVGLDFRLYDCRHTFATRQVEGGTDLLTLAHLLGHASLDEVMRYAHVNEKRKSEAIQNMEKRQAKAV